MIRALLFAIDYFVYRASLFAGMLAAALQGVDALVFTAGVGENSAPVRAAIAEKLAWLGVSIDADANAKTRTPDLAAGEPASRSTCCRPTKS